MEGKTYRPGDEVESEDFNAIWRAIRSLRYLLGPKQRTNQTRDGWTLFLEQPEQPPQDLGLKLQVKMAPGSTVTVTYGIVNNLVPTINSVGLDVEPAPQLDITDNGWVFMDVTVSTDEDGNAVATAAAVEFIAASSVPVNEATHSYRALAQITNYTAATDSSPASFKIKMGWSFSMSWFRCQSITSYATDQFVDA